MDERTQPHHIAILAYPHAQAAAVHGLTDMFLAANRRSQAATGVGPHRFAVTHWSPDPDGSDIIAVHAAQEGPVQTEQTMAPAAVIVPPSLVPGATDGPSDALTGWLCAQHRAGAIVCSICAGAFLLAEAGLLNGRKATTHWALHNSFQARFPAVRLDTDELIVDDGDVVTAGGIMAWVDLGLRLIGRFGGPALMLDVARLFLVDPGGREQRFYSVFAPRLDHGDKAILSVQHWLQAEGDRPVTIREMAARAGLGDRTFLRRFQKATGLNPTAYVQQLRVGRARDLLERSTLPFADIAWRLGYEDAGAFRKVFQKIVGLGPADYRRRFAVS